MNEQDYREIMGTSIHFHVIIDPSCNKEQYLEIYQMFAESCTKMIGLLHKNDPYTELALFTDTKKRPVPFSVDIVLQRN